MDNNNNYENAVDNKHDTGISNENDSNIGNESDAYADVIRVEVTIQMVMAIA